MLAGQEYNDYKKAGRILLMAIESQSFTLPTYANTMVDPGHWKKYRKPRECGVFQEDDQLKVSNLDIRIDSVTVLHTHQKVTWCAVKVASTRILICHGLVIFLVENIIDIKGRRPVLIETVLRKQIDHNIA